MSNSVWPHGLQPTRLLCPRDSPGKNTGVGCHFLLQCIKVETESEVAQSCPTLRPHGLQPTRLFHPRDSPGKNTGVGCHFLLQCMKVESEKWSRSVVSNSSWPHGLQPTRLLRPWDFPGNSTGVGCHCILHDVSFLATYSYFWKFILCFDIW